MNFGDPVDVDGIHSFNNRQFSNLNSHSFPGNTQSNFNNQ